MKKKAFIIDKNIHETTLICVDIDNCSEIIQYLYRTKVEDEFKEIRDILKQNLRNKEKYKKIEGNMFEMRFVKNGRNDRIYCQEMHQKSKRFIIMCELFEGKKTQEIPKKIKARIDSMSNYIYEII